MNTKKNNGPVIGQKIVQEQDWHAVLSRLLLKAEKSPDSLERMLAVTRLLLTFLTQIMKPGRKFQDTPTVVLGEHYLSHRDLSGDLHRGDHTRSYLQELCAYDPIEAPVNPKKYSEQGHTEVGTMFVSLVPKAQARIKREGIIGGQGQVYVAVDLEGQGKLYYRRHDEEYVFNFPSLILSDALSEACPIDLEGVVDISCEATGLHTELKFKPWRDEYVKGEVRSLLGDGTQVVARIEGQWDAEVSVYSVSGDANGVLFSTSDDPPRIKVPPVVNLSEPGPQTMRRLWSAVIESLLYCECQNHTGSMAKKLQDYVAVFPSLLKKSLLYEIPVNPQARSALSAGGDMNDPTSQLAAALDKRPLPPVCKIQRALNRFLTYQIKYSVQAIGFEALEHEVSILPNAKEIVST
jgi:hypothetical protein